MIGLMVIELNARHLHSLKDKRKVISSLKERLRQKYNVALSETDHQESWQKAQVSIASVSNSRRVLESVFKQVEKTIDETCEMQITNLRIDYT